MAAGDTNGEDCIVAPVLGCQDAIPGGFPARDVPGSGGRFLAQCISTARTHRGATRGTDSNTRGAPWSDSGGATLPLAKGDHWQLLALSGGAPVNFVGEWDGEALLPLGVMVNGRYHL